MGKTLAILACLLALSYAAEKTAEQEQSAQLVEPVDQLPEEQRYGGYGGHRYGGHYGGHVDTDMDALLPMKPRNLKEKNRDTEVTVEDTVVTAMAALLKETEETLMVDTVDNIEVTSMALPLLSRLHTMI